MKKIKAAFKNAELPKQAYIDKMYAFHQLLFDYSALLAGTDIQEIQITDDGVIFTSRQDGIKIYCAKADKRTAPFEILNFDTYEANESALFYKLASGCSVIFDIGANIGWYSISMAKKFPGAKIYSFEPLPSTFNDLARNIDINNVTNIRINNFGFSNENKTLVFFSSPDTSVSNSSKNIAHLQEAIQVECKVLTLDSYIAENNLPIDFIKCDVEGAELYVFEGGIKTLREHTPIVFTEMLRKWAKQFGYHPNNIIELFAKLDYRCFVNSGKDTLRELFEVKEDTTETNFFFLHSVKHKNIIDANV